MDYFPKYFKPYELLPKALYYELLGLGWPERRIWQLFDPRTLLVNDKLRARYGKMVANTWYWGGRHQWRGFRPCACPVGALYSQHRYGRASDLVPVEVTVEEIRNDIIQGENFLYISCIEMEVPWLHHDERNYRGLLLIYPKVEVVS